MNRVQIIYDLTLKLDRLLDHLNKSNREETIQAIEQLIEERGHKMVDMKAPYTNDEKKIDAKLVQLNESVQKKLEQTVNELKRENKQIQKQKKSNRSYINPYGNRKNMRTIDGLYIDSKQ